MIAIGLGVGAVTVPLASEYWAATSGLVLVGVGWSCVSVAATALLADNVASAEGGRAVGVLDSVGGLASIILPPCRWRPVAGSRLRCVAGLVHHALAAPSAPADTSPPPRVGVTPMQPRKKQILNRLATIEGHLRGIRKMVKDDVYCVDIPARVFADSRSIEILMSP